MGLPPWLLVVTLLQYCALYITHSSAQQQGHEPQYPDNTIGDEERKQMCAFFAGGRAEIPLQGDWQKQGLCTTETTMHWLDVAARNCISCQTGRNVCKKPPVLLFHQFLDSLHPTLWRANLLSAQSVLVTQDLRRTRFIMWVLDFKDLTGQPEVKDFFDRFRAHVQLRRIRWRELTAGTPFEGHPYFGNLQVLRQTLTRAAIGDLLRLLLVHRYGGAWIDNDVVIMRDFRPLLIHVGYQFAMRWVNGHVFYVRKGSLLGDRLLNFTASIPYSDDTIQDVVKNVCEPLGYFPASPSEYGNKDIYNGCTLRYGLERDNNGTLSNVLFDYPLGWFDPIWAQPPLYREKQQGSGSCLDIRKALPRDEWVAQRGREDHSYHTRWPKVQPEHHPLEVNSPLGRSIRILEHIFRECKEPSCLPQEAGFLCDYHTLIDNLPEPASII